MEKFDTNEKFVSCNGLYTRKILYIICIWKFSGLLACLNIIVREHFMLLPSGFYFDCALEGITGRLVPNRETEGDYIVFIVVVNYIPTLFPRYFYRYCKVN